MASARVRSILSRPTMRGSSTKRFTGLLVRSRRGGSRRCLLAVRAVIWDSEASATVGLQPLSGPLDSRVEFVPSHGSNLEFPVRRNPC